MAAKIRLRGLQFAVKSLNREIKKIEGRTVKGLLAAAEFIEGESNEIVPHRKGVLLGSSFSDADVINGRPVARVGYTAEYSPWVHEMPETNNFTKPDTGPKFLQKPVFQKMLRTLTPLLRRSLLSQPLR